MIFNERDQELRDLGYQKHAFNLLISNRLGYHRAVPDTRDAECVRPPLFPSSVLETGLLYVVLVFLVD